MTLIRLQYTGRYHPISVILFCIVGLQMNVNFPDEEEWPQSTIGKSMQRFEFLLQCQICCEFFKNPQLLACGHSFCYECIAKHFDKVINVNASDACPSCRFKSQLSDLRPNRQLSEIVESFSTLRNELCKCLVEDKCNSKSSDSKSFTKNSSSVGIGKTKITKKIPFHNFHGESRDKTRRFIQDNCSTSKVQLNLDGEKKVLENRFRQFLYLHNAQLDAINPLSLEEVIIEINRREQALSNELKKSANFHRIVQDIKEGGTNEVVDNGFANLIKKVKSQKAAGRDNNKPSKVNTKQHTTWGDWNIVMSDKLGIPFFYNTKLKTGQFAVPSDLEELKNIDFTNCEVSLPLIDESQKVENNVEEIPKSLNSVRATRSSSKSKTIVSDSYEPISVSKKLKFSVPEATQYTENDNLIRSTQNPDFVSSSGYDDFNLSENSKTDDRCISILSDEENEISMNSASASPVSWTCEVCTFINSNSKSNCEMCDNRNKSVPKSSSKMSSLFHMKSNSKSRK